MLSRCLFIQQSIIRFMRHAVVEGQFYPSKKDELRKMIDEYFSSLEIASQKDREIKAGIVPHAGYAFSGKCAAFLYHLLRNNKFDTFVMLGTNHSGLGDNLCFSIEDFDNSIGKCECDLELTEELLVEIKKTPIKTGVDENAHKYEHSIEVQLPFLQIVQKGFKIVPILVKDLSIKEIEKIGNIISLMIKNKAKEGKRIFVLASSDLTHYGRGYGFLPFADNVRENLRELDGKAIDAILNLDVEKFYGEARRSTICGGMPVSLCLQIAKNLRLHAEKLCYYTSGDVTGKWDNVVGYASIGFS